ncbi:MAG: hypothetical protein Q8N00_05525 [Nitrospirota bacterium]|nr:hypothetical protein [Nitrospirota bacterium]
MKHGMIALMALSICVLQGAIADAMETNRSSYLVSGPTDPLPPKPVPAPPLPGPPGPNQPNQPNQTLSRI